ncbi:MAG: hypothetical protein ACRD6W_00955, partial [Nitrososphaerales archaeon]
MIEPEMPVERSIERQPQPESCAAIVHSPVCLGGDALIVHNSVLKRLTRRHRALGQTSLLIGVILLAGSHSQASCAPANRFACSPWV